MKKVISMFAILVMIGVLCAGCEKADTSTPEAVDQQKKSNTKNWEPETLKQPTTHDAGDGQDHSGHNHP